MSPLRDWSLGQRLGIAFAAVLVLCATLAGAILSWLDENGALLADYSSRSVRQVALGRALERNVPERMEPRRRGLRYFTRARLRWTLKRLRKA